MTPIRAALPKRGSLLNPRVRSSRLFISALIALLVFARFSGPGPSFGLAHRIRGLLDWPTQLTLDSSALWHFHSPLLRLCCVAFACTHISLLTSFSWILLFFSITQVMSSLYFTRLMQATPRVTLLLRQSSTSILASHFKSKCLPRIAREII